MKVEAVASNSAGAALAAPASTLSDEEYARRLYAELNGAVLKTRRSAKLGATQPKKDGAAAAANDASSNRAEQEQQQEDEAPAATAAPAASVVDSTAAQPTPAAVDDSKDGQPHPPAPAKKLTGLHRELQRLLGDPVPVCVGNNTASTSSTPKTAGSAVGTAFNSTAAAAAAPVLAASLGAGGRRGRGDAAADASSARQDAPAAVQACTQQQEVLAKAELQDACQGAGSKPRTLRVRLSPDQQLVAAAAAAGAAAGHGTEERAAAEKQQQQQQAHKAAGGLSRTQGRAAAPSHEGCASSGEAQQDARQQQLRRAADAAHKGGKQRLVPAPVAVLASHPTVEPEAGARSTRSSARVVTDPPCLPPAKAGVSTASSPTTAPAAAAAKAEGRATVGEAAPAPVVQPHKASFKRSRPLALASSPLASSPPTSPRSALPPADASMPKAAVVSVTVKAEAAAAPLAPDTSATREPASEPTPTTAADDDVPAAPRRLAVRLGVRRQASASDSAAHPPPARNPSPLPHSPPVGPPPTASKPAAAPAPAPPAAPPAAAASVTSGKPRRIPKMPMVCDGTRWYRAKVLQQRAGRVLVEFMGLEQAPVPFWLDVTSECIWTGSYKGKDWRYLGGGAWEPKRGATNGRHGTHHRSGGSRPAPASGSGTTDKDFNSAAGSDTDLGEDSGRSRRAPALAAAGKHPAGGRGAAAAAKGEAGEPLARRARSSRGSSGTQQQQQEEEGPGMRAGEHREPRIQQREKERESEGQAQAQAATKWQLRSAPAPSGSSQEHAGTWHEPAADDSHSCEDGAVTAPPRKPRHLPPIDTTLRATAAAAPATPADAPAAALTASASCSAEAGTTPHATSASASTLHDPLLSCVASCRPDAPAAAARAPQAPAGAEELSRACVESVVTSCVAPEAAAAVSGGAAVKQQPQLEREQGQRQGGTLLRPSSPHESALPHRCRRKGKPMRACIDTEEERLAALSAASSDSAPAAPLKPQDSHTGSSARPSPLLSAALLVPTSDDEPAPPTSHPTPSPAAAPPASRMLSCTLSSSTATAAAAAHQDSCADAPPHPEFATAAASAAPLLPSLSHAPNCTPADDDEGAALLASLRQGAAASAHPPGDAPHPVHKKRRRGNGWTKIMRPSRPSHYYYQHAPSSSHHHTASAAAGGHWDDEDAPAPAGGIAPIPSYHDSSTASHHHAHVQQPGSPRSNPHPHPPTASSRLLPPPPASSRLLPRLAPARSDVHSNSPVRALTHTHTAPSHPHEPTLASAGATPRFGEGSLSAAPAALAPSTLLPPAASHTSALRAVLKRPWDTLLDTPLLPHASTLTSTAASFPCAAPPSSTLPPPFKRAATSVGNAPVVSRVSATAGLPSSLLSCLQAPAITALAALPGLCRPEPLQLLMACPPKPPMPLFKPL